MKKRGQIVVFMMLTVVIVAVIGFLFYINGSSVKDKSTASIEKSSEIDNIKIVKSFAETCIKIASEDALFNKVGLHAGYINPDGNPEYGENRIKYPDPTYFLGNSVPYYLEASATSGVLQYNTFIPSLDIISKKLANYIAVKFENCFNASVFKELGLIIKKPYPDYQSVNFDFTKTDVKVNAYLNEDDVDIKFDYPLIIGIGATETRLHEFNVVLPIRFKALYDSTLMLIENAVKAQPNSYNISKDCLSYDKNGLTNVYVKNSNDGQKIIQFVDYSTYYNNYFNSYIFQFALKNINIVGKCAG